MKVNETFPQSSVRKQEYLSPVTEILEMENEGVIASSVLNMGDGGQIGVNASVRGNHASRANYSSINDLEDLINDILTFEK